MRQIILPVFVVSLLLGLFIPLPVVVIDYLILLNLALAMLLLLSVLFVDQPIKLSTLPTILLLATLFRLVTNVATTRQLLASGTVGSIIPLIGETMIQGSILVGLVVFMIITLVQLIVIAKGAERVAEVSARFTLDALPGKQMAIDADVRAGLIDFETAKVKRNELQVESRFYGALDGAMKFIKGDAVVGIVITLVNLAGGLLTGMVLLNLDLATAAKHYSLMTIGDGIISQIPAILNAVSAGIIITRVVNAEDESLAGEVVVQLLANNTVKKIIAGLCFFFAALPAVPTISFGLVGLIFASLVFYQPKLKQDQRVKVSRFVPEQHYLLQLSLPSALYYNEVIHALEYQISSSLYYQFGICQPQINFLSGQKLIQKQKQDRAAIEFKLGTRRFSYELPIQSFLDNPDQSAAKVADFISDKFEADLGSLLDDRQTKAMLDHYEQSSPELVSNLVPEVISVTAVTKLLKSLINEGLSPKFFDLIVQAIAEHAEECNKPRKLLAAVRIALSSQISNIVAVDSTELVAITVDAAIDYSFARSEISGDAFSAEYLQSLSTAARAHPGLPLVCSSQARAIIADCYRQHNIENQVIAFEELVQTIKIKSIEHISSIADKSRDVAGSASARDAETSLMENYV